MGPRNFSKGKTLLQIYAFNKAAHMWTINNEKVKYFIVDEGSFFKVNKLPYEKEFGWINLMDPNSVSRKEQAHALGTKMAYKLIAIIGKIFQRPSDALKVHIVIDGLATKLKSKQSTERALAMESRKMKLLKTMSKEDAEKFSATSIKCPLDVLEKYVQVAKNIVENSNTLAGKVQLHFAATEADGTCSQISKEILELVDGWKQVVVSEDQDSLAWPVPFVTMHLNIRTMWATVVDKKELCRKIFDTENYSLLALLIVHTGNDYIPKTLKYLGLDSMIKSLKEHWSKNINMSINEHMEKWTANLYESKEKVRPTLPLHEALIDLHNALSGYISPLVTCIDGRVRYLAEPCENADKSLLGNMKECQDYVDRMMEIDSLAASQKK